MSETGTYSEREIDSIKKRISNLLNDVKQGNGGLLPITIKEFLKEIIEVKN